MSCSRELRDMELTRLSVQLNDSRTYFIGDGLSHHKQ